MQWHLNSEGCGCCCGGVFQHQSQGDWSWTNENTEILNENLDRSAQDLRLRWKVHFPTGPDPKQANTMQECIRDDSVNTECPSQSPDLNPIKHLRRDLKMSVHWWSPSTLREIESICREKWQKIPRWLKLVESYPKRLEALITARAELQVRIQSSYFSLVSNGFWTLFYLVRLEDCSLSLIQWLIFLRHNTLFKTDEWPNYWKNVNLIAGMFTSP